MNRFSNFPAFSGCPRSLSAVMRRLPSTTTNRSSFSSCGITIRLEEGSSPYSTMSSAKRRILFPCCSSSDIMTSFVDSGVSRRGFWMSSDSLLSGMFFELAPISPPPGVIIHIPTSLGHYFLRMAAGTYNSTEDSCRRNQRRSLEQGGKEWSPRDGADKDLALPCDGFYTPNQKPGNPNRCGVNRRCHICLPIQETWF